METPYITDTPFAEKSISLPRLSLCPSISSRKLQAEEPRYLRRRQSKVFEIAKSASLNHIALRQKS